MKNLCLVLFVVLGLLVVAQPAPACDNQLVPAFTPFVSPFFTPFTAVTARGTFFNFVPNNGVFLGPTVVNERIVERGIFGRKRVIERRIVR